MQTASDQWAWFHIFFRILCATCHAEKIRHKSLCQSESMKADQIKSTWLSPHMDAKLWFPYNHKTQRDWSIDISPNRTAWIHRITHIPFPTCYYMSVVWSTYNRSRECSERLCKKEVLHDQILTWIFTYLLGYVPWNKKYKNLQLSASTPGDVKCGSVRDWHSLQILFKWISKNKPEISTVD